jgi:coenzyme Q-binding protein COQ10
MPTVDVEMTVPGPPERVMALLADMERFPAFMANLESVTVRERGEGYTISEWVARLQGARFRWVERDEFGADRITFRQVEGDLRRFEGEWVVEPAEGGTRVRFVTTFEFGMPMLATLLNPVAKIALRENGRAMLAAIAAELAREGSA